MEKPIRVCEDCKLTKTDKSFRSKIAKICYTCSHRRFKAKTPNYKALRKIGYLANRDAIIKRKRDRKQATFKAFLSNCLSKKIRKEFGFDLTLEFLLLLLEQQQYRCALSGIKMTHIFNDLRTVSIDRIDSKKGHTKDNVQLVCQFINLGKKNQSNESVLAILADIRAKT